MEFSKVEDNHKIICVTSLVLIFCCKMSIQNSFVQRTTVGYVSSEIYTLCFGLVPTVM